jgi:hypothetical protein
MKLKMHSFDFGECTLTFSVPKEIMHSNSFGNVPGGVEVDLVAITKNAALGIKELAATDTQQPQPESITYCDNRFCVSWDCGVCELDQCHFIAA